MKLTAPPPPPPPPEPPAQGASNEAGTQQPAPTPVRPSEPQLATWPSWAPGVDSALVGLVILFCFMAASFAATNSDVWLHLAAGKRLLAGEYTPGTDPFSYTGADRPWVNHSWLTDAAAYLLYSVSGSVLVVAKALVLAAAFGLLMAIRRPSFPLWPWASLACVGVLAAGPYFTMRPLVVSVLFLAATMFLLFRVPHRPGSWRFPVAIGVTFWLWANCDQWFFVGPLALVLLIVGDLIQKYALSNAGAGNQHDPAAEPLGRLPDTATLAKALGIGVLACMLTPHHVRVWELPFELTGGEVAKEDPRLRAALLTPLDRVYIDEAQLGYNMNGLAFVVLFFGGAAVLGLSAARVRAAHVALWVGFAGLSLLSVFAIPLFAVVTVPLVAAQLNAMSARAVLKTWGDPLTRVLVYGSSIGRVVSVVVVCGLCVAAYPGWVHPEVVRPATRAVPEVRRLGWAVEPDPTMKQAVVQLERWRESGQLSPEARGVIASVELANYAAYFAPREKVFINSRLNHHRSELPDYIALRRTLGLLPARPDEPVKPSDATAILQRAGAEYVAVHAATTETAMKVGISTTPLISLYLRWGEWSVWYLDGRTTVLGWRADPASGRPSFRALRVDPVTLAFAPGTPVPDAPVLQPLVLGDWTDSFVRPAKGAPPGAGEAMAWLEYKAALRGRNEVRRNLSAAVFFSLNAISAQHHRVAMLAADLNGLLPLPPRHDDSEADAYAMRAIPILALRAARRAIAENPDHPDGYYALAQVMLDADLPLSEAERMLCRVAALRQCLIRMPPPERYKGGEYSISATLVALQLVEMYLGYGQEIRHPVRMADKDGKPAMRPDGKADVRMVVVRFPGLAIGVEPLSLVLGDMLVAQGGAGGVGGARVPLDQFDPRTPAHVRLTSAPTMLPLDAAREVLMLLLQYAPLDRLGPTAEQIEKNIKTWEALLTEVEKELLASKRLFDQYRTRGAKLPELVAAARYSSMHAEALKLLTETDVETIKREYGPDVLYSAAQRVMFQLALGRIEDANDTFAALDDPETAPAVRASPLYPTFVRLRYLKSLLAGEYNTAGELWGTLHSDDLTRPGLDRTLAAIQKDKIDPTKLFAAEFLVLHHPIAGSGPLPIVFHDLGLQSRMGPVYLAREALSVKMQRDSSYFTRAGVLALFEGDVPKAKQRFLQTRIKPPDGWRLSPVGSREGEDYLFLIQLAEKQTPP